MILPFGHSTQYLNDYKDGLIPMGKKLGCHLDNHLVWKDSQLNIILGHDNVGKTYFVEWYFLALALKHDMTFTLFMDENYHGKIFRDLIQMYVGRPFKEIPYDLLRRAEARMEHHFKIVDNTKRYTPAQLMDVFNDSDTTNYLIDPYNGLKMSMNYGDNYELLNDLKLFTKQKQQTIYINAHPASASGRRSTGVYPKEHHFAGHVQPPLKSDIEGGKAFSNKADDFIICHRLTQHPTMWGSTMIEVAKIKDRDTGGKPTMLDEPVLLEYNKGLGLVSNGIDVIDHLKESKQTITPNINF